MGVINKAQICAGPGDSKNAFVVPIGWEGSKDDYVAFIREKYVTDKAYRINIDAHVHFYSTNSKKVQISGPFAEEARMIMMKISSRHDQLNLTTAASAA